MCVMDEQDCTRVDKIFFKYVDLLYRFFANMIVFNIKLNENDSILENSLKTLRVPSLIFIFDKSGKILRDFKEITINKTLLHLVFFCYLSSMSASSFVLAAGSSAVLVTLI